MNIIFPILILLSGSFFASIWYKKSSLNLLPLSIFSITVILYIFYMFNLLTVGFYLILIISFSLWILGIYKLFKEKTLKPLEYFFTPGLFIFLIAILIIYIITKDNNVLLWDELRLWGAYPKALFYSGELQLGNNAILGESIQHYLPGMPLFQYFFTKSCGIFRESYLFLSYAIVGLSLFMPFLNKLSWKKWYIGLIILLIVLIFPLTFGNSPTITDFLSYYSTLFIDPILGIMFGYLMYLSINDVFKTKFSLINFCVTLMFMLLLKNTSLLFGIVSILSVITCEIFIYKNIKGKKLIFTILISIFCTLFISGSFKILLDIYNVTIYHVGNINIHSIIGFIFNMSNNQIIIFKKFADNFVKTPILLSNFSFINRFCTPLFFSILYAVILYFLSKKSKKKQIGSIYITLGSILFIIGLIFLYVFDLNHVLSFARYINTLNYALLFFIILNLFELYKSIKIKPLLIVLLISLLIIFPIYKIRPLNNSLKEYKNISDKYTESISNSLIDEDNNIKILCIIDDNEGYYNVIYNHHMHLSTIGTNIFIPSDAMYTVNLNTSLDDFIELYKTQNYNYIYILSLNDTLPNWFTNMVEDDIVVNQLYKSTFKDSKLIFEKVGVKQ